MENCDIKSMAGAVRAANRGLIMQAITTKYFGPTNHRGARIKATSGSGQSVTIGYYYEMDAERAHREAAIALCKKLGWNTNLIQGGTADGYAFVFAPEGNR